MPTFRLMPAEKFLLMPWKNGKGVTRELGIFPPRLGEGLTGFEWRVSIASVPEDGPFSRFEGYDRQLLVLTGTGMTLSHPASGERRTLKPLEPYAFSGAVETVGQLHAGPVEDFNVMTLAGRWQSRVEVLRAGAHARAGAPVVWVYAHAGACHVTHHAPEQTPGGAPHRMHAQAVPQGAALEVTGCEGQALELCLDEQGVAVFVWLYRSAG